MPTPNTFLTCLFIGAFSMTTGSAWSQTGIPDSTGLEVRFLKPLVEIEENSFQFNSLSIRNNSQSSRTVNIRISPPSFINLISGVPGGNIVVESGEIYYLPFRFNSFVDSQYTSTDKFRLSITDIGNGEIKEAEFSVAIKPFYRWRSDLQQPEVVVSDNVNRYKLGFFIENIGNVTDEYTVSIESSSNISLVKKPEKIVLKAGEFRIVELEAMIQFTNTDLNSDINLYIRNKAGEKKLLIQKFRRIGSVFNQKVYARARFPLSIEFYAQNLTTGQAFYSAGVNGAIDLPKERRLTVFTVSDGYYKGYRTKSGFFSLNYITKNNRLSLGNTQDFRQFFVVGNGIDFHHTTKNKGLYRITAIKSKTQDEKLIGFSTEQSLSKRFHFFSDNFVHLDKTRETKSYLSVGGLKWIIDRNTNLSLYAGGGVESISKSKYSFDTSLRGSMGGYEFETKREKWRMKSKISLYSKSIPGFNKGFTYHRHEIIKPVKSGFISAFYDANKKVFNQTYDTLVKLLFNVSNKEAGVRIARMNNIFSVNTTISMYRQQQDSANSPIAHMARFAVNMNWMITPTLSVSLFSNIGKVTIPEMPHIKSYFAFTNFGGIQWKKFGVQFRYDYHPFSYFEIKQFAHVPDSFRYFQTTPYFEHTFKKWNLDYRFNLNYTNDKSLGYNFMLVGNDLNYKIPDQGLEVGLLTQYNIQDRQNSFINLKVRKTLIAPSYRARESFNFDMILFKDINGNDIFDEGDELIPTAELLVNGLLLNTDRTGVLQFRNVGDKSFEVDFSKIRNLRGWMPKAGHKQTILIVANEKKVFIPFRQSRAIHGSVKLIADEKSNRRMSLSNIRVTATDQKGFVFSTLTDANNEFSFDLPAGIYQVMINHGVFDDEFRPAEISKQVDLINNNILEVQFEVRQRKRQINIKHDDDDDEEEEE